MRAPSWQSFGGDHRVMRHFMNVWPPFAGSGVHIELLSADFRSARVALHHRWWARNYVGTLFGGALFAMTDPWWMVLVLRSLGPDYVVWDKAAEIEFIAPGRSTVRAEFVVTDAILDELRAAALNGVKVLRWFETDIVAEDGTVVARVRKQLYVRERRKSTDPVTSP